MRYRTECTWLGVYRAKIDRSRKDAVHLIGSANTKQEADKAATIARGVAGVKSVDNDIHLR